MSPLEIVLLVNLGLSAFLPGVVGLWLWLSLKGRDPKRFERFSKRHLGVLTAGPNYWRFLLALRSEKDVYLRRLKIAWFGSIAYLCASVAFAKWVFG
jgi:hypothetical protein